MLVPVLETVHLVQNFDVDVCTLYNGTKNGGTELRQDSASNERSLIQISICGGGCRYGCLQQRRAVLSSNAGMEIIVYR